MAKSRRTKQKSKTAKVAKVRPQKIKPAKAKPAAKKKSGKKPAAKKPPPAVTKKPAAKKPAIKKSTAKKQTQPAQMMIAGLRIPSQYLQPVKTQIKSPANGTTRVSQSNLFDKGDLPTKSQLSAKKAQRPRLVEKKVKSESPVVRSKRKPSLPPSFDAPLVMSDMLYQGDCIAGMNQMPAGAVDLVFADPPFNIGFEYDVYHDQKGRKEYLKWSEDWISAVWRVLKPNGTLWLAIGDEYAAELKLLAQKIGFVCRSWVVWYYTFGVNCTHKFTRSHAHLFYFVKDEENFTFRAEALENRIPSARQLVYNDKRSNPRGRLPDDTWILRPQDLTGCFTENEDTWYFPRVAGTHKQREGFHGCQMPEQLLGRIIRCCSAEGEVVLDPFSGSATTLAAAKKLNRRYMGFDISDAYIAHGNKRLAAIAAGDPLDGAPEPTMSAPATWLGKMRTDRLPSLYNEDPAESGEIEVSKIEADSEDVNNIIHDEAVIDEIISDEEPQKPDPQLEFNFD